MAAERTVDGYVAALPDGQREIADAVRRLVRSAAPEAGEAFNAQLASHGLAGAVRRSSVATPDRDLKTALPRRRTHSIRLLDLLGG
jgi:hypothetical protein